MKLAAGKYNERVYFVYSSMKRIERSRAFDCTPFPAVPGQRTTTRPPPRRTETKRRATVTRCTRCSSILFQNAEAITTSLVSMMRNCVFFFPPKHFFSHHSAPLLLFPAVVFPTRCEYSFSFTQFGRRHFPHRNRSVLIVVVTMSSLRLCRVPLCSRHIFFPPVIKSRPIS